MLDKTVHASFRVEHGPPLVVWKVPVVNPPRILDKNWIALHHLLRIRTSVGRVSILSISVATGAHSRSRKEDRDNEAKQCGISLSGLCSSKSPERIVWLAYGLSLRLRCL